MSEQFIRKTGGRLGGSLYDKNGTEILGGSGTGTVTSVSVTTANGVSGSVATETTTPAITLTLGAITPSSVAATGNVTGANLAISDWNTAYTDRLKWDGGSTGLTAETGRTSLGLGDSATKNVGTGAGDVAAGNHNHDSAYSPLASPTFTGTVTLPTVQLGEASMKLDAALSADGKWSGITETGTAGAALAFGDLCYFQAADSRWELVDANLSAGYDKKLGICVLAAAGDGSATEMLLYGKVRADSVFPDLTIGSPVYMSETAGDITMTAPTTTDSATRIVGYGNTADELFFCPSPDYITHT